MKNEEPPVDIDALAASLDRGWELLEKGDVHGARHAGEKALEMDADCAEALTIMGMAASLVGEQDEALELYTRAMDSDPEDVPPILYAAEIHAAQGREGKALELVENALDAAEEEEDYLDALLLQVEILMSLERDEEARRALGAMPQNASFPDGVYHVRAAQAWLELGDLEAAEMHYEKAVALDAKSADALHGLGMVKAERGDHPGMVKAWLAARELDLKAPRAQWTLSRDKFQKIAQSAFDELPEEMQELLGEVPIVLSDVPSEEMVKEGVDPRLLGVFTGTPLTAKESMAGGEPVLTNIHIFQRNIERISHDGDEAEEEIRITLIHETAHFFGLDDDALEERGLG